MSVQVSVESLSKCLWNGCPSARGIRTLVTVPIFEDETHQYWDALDTAREVARRIGNSRITVVVRCLDGYHGQD